MAERYRRIAARLRALTYASPGIIQFASALEGEASDLGRIRSAAGRLTDRERAQLVAFLVQLRHDQLDVENAEQARVIGALVDTLAGKEWEDLPALGPDSDESVS